MKLAAKRKGCVCKKGFKKKNYCDYWDGKNKKPWCYTENLTKCGEYSKYSKKYWQYCTDYEVKIDKTIKNETNKIINKIKNSTWENLLENDLFFDIKKVNIDKIKNKLYKKFKNVFNKKNKEDNLIDKPVAAPGSSEYTKKN